MLIAVLAAGTGPRVPLNLKVAVVYFRLSFPRHNHGDRHRRGVDAALALCRWHPLDTMAASLVGEAR